MGDRKRGNDVDHLSLPERPRRRSHNRVSISTPKNERKSSAFRRHTGKPANFCSSSTLENGRPWVCVCVRVHAIGDEDEETKKERKEKKKRTEKKHIRTWDRKHKSSRSTLESRGTCERLARARLAQTSSSEGRETRLITRPWRREGCPCMLFCEV
jgi:hypothetical protein